MDLNRNIQKKNWIKINKRNVCNNGHGRWQIDWKLALNHVQNTEDGMRGILKSKNKQPRCFPLSIKGHLPHQGSNR